MKAQVTVIDHPLVQHKLTLMRRSQSSTAKFRALLKEISLLAYEVTRDLPLKYESITTPVATMNAPILAPDKKLVHGYIVPGLGDVGDRLFGTG